MKKRAAADIFKEQQESITEEEMAYDDFGEEPMVQQQMNAPVEMPIEPSATETNINEIDKPPIMSYEKQKKEKMRRAKKKKPQFSNIKTSEEMQLEKEPIQVRITGRWFWMRVIVPPNAYVVHTRIKKKQPVTLGLGLSFKYKPKTDAFLVVPAAMQTIGVVANCISKEKQGINVLAYVQWQIEDFSVAYKKLDFSDSRDPLGIVNAQLREQAEAAIKDKIATMSVEEVLTDKAPIIEELTSRLKQVAEGQTKGDKTIKEGLGIKIATVQIREAFVSSTNLWEDLQSPFRHEQKQKASISYLDMQNEIKKKELEARKLSETREVETKLEIEQTKQKKETEIMELKLNEEGIRYKKQQETYQEKLKLEEQSSITQKETKARLQAKENEIKLKGELTILKQADEKAAEEAKLNQEAKKREIALALEQKLYQISEDAKVKETIHKIRTKQMELDRILSKKQSELNTMQQKQNTELEKLKLTAVLDRATSQQKAKLAIEADKNKLLIQHQENLVKIEKIRQEIRNLVSSNVVFSQLIKELPQIAAKMPEVKELKIFQSNQNEPLLDNLVSFINKFMSMADSLGIKLPFKKDKKK